MIDAGFASLATFVAGLAAVNLLSNENRGVYGVFFAAFVVGTTFPHNLVYLPSQVYAVAQPLADRMRYIGRVTGIGLAYSSLGAIAIVFAAVVTASHTTWPVTVALTLTAGLSVAVSAAQDNLRRMLHVRERHWSAASMSMVQLAVVSISVVTMLSLDVPVYWVPFGSLFIANIVSSTLGFVRAGGLGEWDAPVELAPRSLVTSGRWLLGQAIVPTGATFLATAIITSLAGAAAMGYAEAARIVAQPVLVVATGLTAVLGPRVMAAGVGRDQARGSMILRRFSILTIIPGLLYLAIAGWDVPWNPMAIIVPSAYAIVGLVAASIVANIASGLVFLRVEELMGARREVDLVKVSFAASVFMVAVALTAGVTESFALPLGVLFLSLVRYLGYWHYRRKVYDLPVLRFRTD